LAVSESADFTWCFVEEPHRESACVGCVFPRIAAAAGERQQCRPTPAVLDVLLVVAGMALYAVDSLLMGRPRGWNYRDVHLIWGAAEAFVTPRKGCLLCAPQEVER
jgi:hypothetical protein